MRGFKPWPVNFPAQRTSNAENISIWWRHHDRVCGQAGPIWTANRLLHSSGAMAVRLPVWWDITSDWLSIMFQRPLTFPYTFSPYTYWHALAKLSTSSHNLEIERGRHTRPVTPADLRVCTACNVDEEHWRLHRIAHIALLSFQTAISHKLRQVRWGELHASVVTEWSPACLHK